MKAVILDGKNMTTIEIAHEYLITKLDLPDYYGKNLDALWDILSTLSEPIKIILVNEDNLIDYLGGYAKLLLNVLYEAAEFNEKLYISAVGSKTC